MCRGKPQKKPETETETESATESAEVATAMQNIYRFASHTAKLSMHSTSPFPLPFPAIFPRRISHFPPPPRTGTRTRSAAAAAAARPRVQKVLPTVLISHNYTITKRKVFSTRHAPRPSARSPSTPRTQCQLRVMEMSSQKRQKTKKITGKKKQRKNQGKRKTKKQRKTEGGFISMLNRSFNALKAVED